MITLFAFKIPHRNAPTVAVNSQPLSTFTHCEETCPLQVRYYPKEKYSPAPQPINPLEEEASTLGAITGISHCTEPVGPQRSSEKHNFPPPLWSKSCPGVPSPFESSHEQGSPRLVQAEAPTIIRDLLQLSVLNPQPVPLQARLTSSLHRTNSFSLWDQTSLVHPLESVQKKTGKRLAHLQE